MPERFKYLSDEFIILLAKFLPTALLAVSISTALKMKKEKVTIMNVLTSFVVGVGVAWFFSSFIYGIENDQWHSPLIAVVAISGEKIAEYLIYKWDVDKFMNQLTTALQDLVINIFKKK